MSEYSIFKWIYGFFGKYYRAALFLHSTKVYQELSDYRVASLSTFYVIVPGITMLKNQQDNHNMPKVPNQNI